MRIVFMGTPDFAKLPLEYLIKAGHDVAGVFTQPDRPKNRGMKLSFSPVKEVAMAHGIEVFQPDSLKDGFAAGKLRELGCELVVAVAYGKILPPDILAIPPLGCINIHGSLLPKYRGAAPIQWSVLNGEKETGVTAMYMDKELDAGDILFMEKTAIGDDETSGELYERLKVMGAELLCQTVSAISDGGVSRKPQDHADATFAPMLSKDMSPVDWSESAFNIKCKVRGLNPWPTATAVLGGKTCKLFSVDISDEKTSAGAGEIVSAGKLGIKVACADGSVIIKELQAPGGKRMNAADFLRGNPL